MLRYLEAFARDRGLFESIEFGRCVELAAPRADDSWRVVFSDGEERFYKGVVVCNGHHWDPIRPDMPGSFTGDIIHSKDYDTPADLAGKRVLVVGGGNSGCDIASEAARVATSCDWSLREGYWFLPRAAFGRPLSDLPIWELPVVLQRPILRAIIRVTIGDYRAYGLKRPTHRIFDRHPAFGNEPLSYIKTGDITPRPAIERLDDQTVHFTDGSSAEYDLIVTATGYHTRFPFLPDGLIPFRNGIAQLRSDAFPDSAKNLYVVGASQPRNGLGSLLTPVADFYAKLIRMQDEFDVPMGIVLKWTGEGMPTSNSVNPTLARRYVWLGQHTQPVLRFLGRVLSRYHKRPPLAFTEPAQPESIPRHGDEPRPAA
jgi:cation diffusion facilitator CzcD-associated flavoprotein CzcO